MKVELHIIQSLRLHVLIEMTQMLSRIASSGCIAECECPASVSSVLFAPVLYSRIE